MTELTAGDKAPDFSLPANGGATVSLEQFSGKPLVLYFYPKDDTSGCTVEAVDFTKLSADFAAIGATVVGVSPDSVKSHDKFAAKHSLSVMLASDESHAALEAYGVWKEKSMYGKTYMGVERTTFLIDGSGKIAEIWRKVKVPGHAEAVLKAAQAL
ncbi:bacterioferritin [Rhizobium sp. Root274]|uniref:thioredoxin-dependent thiol peroxidase n=1 Tax=unclassified Rhizobium TaxID=2613769 RepID=UPI00071550BB|nr:MULTISPECIES: thioredoxin-dependent thiol peroxidase [unclassified Rhizobium]KQW28638.1 bacterioferritin [Rhizobium sp. Root1240]KRD28840.1 bacterioferritin [Rhizobium sp. Root274]